MWESDPMAKATTAEALVHSTDKALVGVRF